MTPQFGRNAVGELKGEETDKSRWTIAIQNTRNMRVCLVARKNSPAVMLLL